MKYEQRSMNRGTRRWTNELYTSGSCVQLRVKKMEESNFEVVVYFARGNFNKVIFCKKKII